MLCERTSEQWLWYDPALLWRGMTGQTGSVTSQLATSTLYSWVGPAWTPRLGSKWGKWAERLSDFGKYKGYFKNHTKSPPTHPTLSQVRGVQAQAGPTQLYTPLVTIIAEHSVSGDIVASLIISHYILIMWTIIVCCCVPTTHGIRFGNI